MVSKSILPKSPNINFHITQTNTSEHHKFHSHCRSAVIYPYDINLNTLGTNYNTQRQITSGKWKLAVYGLNDQDEEVESWKFEYIILLGLAREVLT